MRDRVLAELARHKYAYSASLAIALMVLQFGTMRLSASESVVRIVLPATIALVPFALWTYRQHAGVWMMLVGLAANLAAVVANGGLMPIERSTVVDAVGVERAAGYAVGKWIPASKDVVVNEGDGQLVALGDSIILRVGDGGLVVSPGDLVVWAGVLVLAAEAAVAWQRRSRERAHIAGGQEPASVHPAAEEQGGAVT